MTPFSTDPSDVRRAVAERADRLVLYGSSGPLVVGVSGGVDSMVLLHLLADLGRPLHVCHVNYGLRGEASDADEALVRRAAERLGASIHVHRTDRKEMVEGGSGSIQNWARRIRYTFFRDTARAVSASVVAVGHHFDDQVETVLMNLFRGAGARGLRGMRPRRRLDRHEEIYLVRPLLDVRRSDILGFAEREHIPWREDDSNASPTYRRNEVRARLLPEIRRVFGAGAERKIAGLGELMHRYAELEDWALEKILEERGGCVSVSLIDLASVPSALAGRLVLGGLERVMPDAPRGQAAVREILRLSASRPGRHIRMGSGIVWRDRDALVFAGANVSRVESVVEAPGCTKLPGGTLTVAWTDSMPERGAILPIEAFIDGDRVSGRLRIRPWSPGDRIRPLGLAGTKLVSDVLTDACVPVAERGDALVVEDERAILWVVGLCVSDEFRVRPETSRILHLRWERHNATPFALSS